MMLEEKVIFDKLKKYSGNQTENNYNIASEGLKNSIENINALLTTLKSNQINTSYRYLDTGTGIKGKLKWFLKKVIRRLNFFYVQPICEQQSVFNTAATQCVERLLQVEVELDAQHTQMENEYQNLEKMFALVSERADKVDMLVEKIKDAGLILDPENDNFWIKKTYAQSGEDSIIQYILYVLGINMEKASYLDLGANHAKSLSNTYALYQRGMHGVLLEANPGLIPELKLYRDKDIILNKCLALDSSKPIKFYVLSGDGLSTSDKNAVEDVLKKNPAISVKEEIIVDTITINEILEMYFESMPTVLNIDIEGQELSILKNIDLKKNRPLIILVEMIEYTTMINKGEKNQKILEFMLQNGYVEYAFTGINSIFVDGDIWKNR